MHWQRNNSSKNPNIFRIGALFKNRGSICLGGAYHISPVPRIVKYTRNVRELVFFMFSLEYVSSYGVCSSIWMTKLKFPIMKISTLEEEEVCKKECTSGARPSIIENH